MSNPTNSVSDTRGDLPAGRELDMLVADRVLGLFSEEWVTGADGTQERCVRRDDWAGGYCVEIKRLDGRTAKWSYVCSHYSTDIRAAWDVVESLTRTTKQWFRFEQSCVTWVASFATEGAGDLDAEYSAEGESAPHAICLAALKAVAP